MVFTTVSARRACPSSHSGGPGLTCASRLAHRVETAIAFRLHNALGTQNERYFVAVNPTAHSLACLRIGVFVTADVARLATGVGGSPFTGRVSHPLDGEQSFMTSPHRHSPFDQPCLVAPRNNAPEEPPRSEPARNGFKRASVSAVRASRLGLIQFCQHGLEGEHGTRSKACRAEWIVTAAGDR